MLPTDPGRASVPLHTRLAELISGSRLCAPILVRVAHQAPGGPGCVLVQAQSAPDRRWPARPPRNALGRFTFVRHHGAPMASFRPALTEARRRAQPPMHRKRVDAARDAPAFHRLPAHRGNAAHGRCLRRFLPQQVEQFVDAPELLGFANDESIAMVNSGPRPCLFGVGFPPSGLQDGTHKHAGWDTLQPAQVGHFSTGLTQQPPC